MEAYKPYIDYLLNGGVAETAYILSHQGAICGTNLPIQQLPSYNFEIEDEKDPNIKHNIVVDERVNLLEALSAKGVVKGSKAGIRLYNQKYYTVRYDDDGTLPTLYLKKVILVLFRNMEELALSRPRLFTSLELSILPSKCKMVFLRIQESLIKELKVWPTTSISKIIDSSIDIILYILILFNHNATFIKNVFH